MIYWHQEYERAASARALLASSRQTAYINEGEYMAWGLLLSIMFFVAVFISVLIA